MPFASIQELKRGYSANFDLFSVLLDKNIENHSDIYENSKQIVENLNLILKDTKDFQILIDSSPELKVGNIINANLTSKELFELSESQIPKGLLPNILKLLEKLEKNEKLLLEEKNEKEKQELEKCCAEIFKLIQEESTKLKLKVIDFLKFLETAGNFEIKNNIENKEEGNK